MGRAAWEAVSTQFPGVCKQGNCSLFFNLPTLGEGWMERTSGRDLGWNPGPSGLVLQPAWPRALHCSGAARLCSGWQLLPTDASTSCGIKRRALGVGVSHRSALTGLRGEGKAKSWAGAGGRSAARPRQSPPLIPPVPGQDVGVQPSLGLRMSQWVPDLGEVRGQQESLTVSPDAETLAAFPRGGAALLAQCWAWAPSATPRASSRRPRPGNSGLGFLHQRARHLGVRASVTCGHPPRGWPVAT